MEVARRPQPVESPAVAPRRIDVGAAAVWLLGFGLVLYLSLKGGGYDSIVRNQVGIAIWWIVLTGVLVGALPLRRPGPIALITLGLLGAYVLWTALSFSWSESSERTATDLSRVATYLGIFALALFVRGSRGTRRLVAALGAGIAVVSLVALLSRLHPTWFENAGQTGQFLTETRSRLSYPLNYWNGLAILIAVGMPLVLHVATSARAVAVRVAAAGVLPAMMLTLFFTLSRGGTIAAAAGLLVYMALANDRLPKALTLGGAGAGGTFLIAAASQRDALQSGLVNGTARAQGNEMLVIALVVCFTVALFQAGLSFRLMRGVRPAWMLPPRRQTIWGAVGAVVAALAVAAALNAPGRAADAWSDFKSAESPGRGAARFESFRGNGRYQYWSSTLDEHATDPPKGSGAGTFEYWWARNGDLPGFVRDAHSLYLETLGELGIVGLLLIVAFLAAILVTGIARTARAARQRRAQLAAAVAGCAAFSVAAGFDWAWELAVIPVTCLLLASVIVTAGDPSDPSRDNALPWYGRLATVAVAAAAIIAIAIPLSSASLIQRSQEQAAAGDLADALDAARSAENVQPYAATPHLQAALVLELQGRLHDAAAAARSATDREPTNWRTWLTLSRLEAERGNVPAAVAAYRRARSLNPRSVLFAR